MGRLVFVGSANADTIAVVPTLPGPDERLVAERIVSGFGGNAATAAVAAARLGAETAFIGPVSDDELGRRVESGLADEGVDTSGLVRVPEGTGGQSVVLVDRSSGTRAICVQVAPEFTVGSAGAALISGATWVHVDYLGWPAVQPLPAGDLARLSVDAGNDIPGLSLGGVGLYAPTVPALRRAYGALPVRELLERAVAEGAVCVVATDGARGCAGLTAGGSYVEVPAFAVDVVSTLGAGDVFHGALLACLDRGMALPEAMRYANGAAALSCRAVDGRSGIPDFAELDAWVRERRRPGEKRGPSPPAGTASTPRPPRRRTARRSSVSAARASPACPRGR